MPSYLQTSCSIFSDHLFSSTNTVFMQVLSRMKLSQFVSFARTRKHRTRAYIQSRGLGKENVVPVPGSRISRHLGSKFRVQNKTFWYGAFVQAEAWCAEALLAWFWERCWHWTGSRPCKGMSRVYIYSKNCVENMKSECVGRIWPKETTDDMFARSWKDHLLQHSNTAGSPRNIQKLGLRLLLLQGLRPKRLQVPQEVWMPLIFLDCSLHTGKFKVERNWRAKSIVKSKLTGNK